MVVQYYVLLKQYFDLLIVGLPQAITRRRENHKYVCLISKHVHINMSLKHIHEKDKYCFKITKFRNYHKVDYN